MYWYRLYIKLDYKKKNVELSIAGLQSHTENVSCETPCKKMGK
jgi:hypothetical protein